MQWRSHQWLLGLALACVALSGCGVRQQLVRPTLPSITVAARSGDPVVIAQVVDSRPAASIPMDTAHRANNVGVQGKPCCALEVQLADGTVAALMHRLVGVVFTNAGYQVVPDAQNATQVTVTLTQFEAHAPFDFWRAVGYAQQMKAHIGATVDVSGPGGHASYTVAGYGSNVFQRMSEDNWEIAINRAIDDFAHKLRTQLATSPPG